MDDHNTMGLGSLLRHLTDLLDAGSQNAYRAVGLDLRPRYVPLLRALGDGPLPVTVLRDRARQTQGAISQTVKLMEAAGLVSRTDAEDGRSRPVALTAKGVALRDRLEDEWQARLAAVAMLEREIDAPLRAMLARAVDALEREGFADRLARCREVTE